MPDPGWCKREVDKTDQRRDEESGTSSKYFTTNKFWSVVFVKISSLFTSLHFKLPNEGFPSDLLHQLFHPTFKFSGGLPCIDLFSRFSFPPSPSYTSEAEWRDSPVTFHIELCSVNTEVWCSQRNVVICV